MKLSVIIPAYNVQDYIIKTLASLTKQANRNFEIIVVDDGSKDESRRVAEAYLKEASFPHYQIVQKENGGVSSARNAGIEAANGEYVFFLDGDDYVSDHFIEQVYAVITPHAPDVICWAYDRVDPNGQTVTRYFADWSDGLGQMTGHEALAEIHVQKRLSIWNGSALYNKNMLDVDGIRYTEGCINGEDQEFIYKALSQAEEVYFIKHVLSYYLQRGSSISFSYNPKRMDVIGALERSGAYLEEEGVSGEVVETLTQRNLLKEYVTNVFSCIVSLKNSKAYSTRKAFTVVKDDIQQYEAGLHSRVAGIYKATSGLGTAEKMKYFLFFNFPVVYFDLITRKYKQKGTI